MKLHTLYSLIALCAIGCGGSGSDALGAPTGRDGRDGEDGTDGLAGIPGTQGPAGPKGDKGAQGEQGPAGTGASYSKADTYMTQEYLNCGGDNVNTYNVSAHCADVGDILLNGGCRIVMTPANTARAMLQGSRPLDVDDNLNPAGWECEAAQGGCIVAPCPAVMGVYAYAVCLKP